MNLSMGELRRHNIAIEAQIMQLEQATATPNPTTSMLWYNQELHFMYNAIRFTLLYLVLRWNLRPGIDTIQDGHRHPPYQVGLYMAMNVERAWVDNLIPEDYPSRTS